MSGNELAGLIEYPSHKPVTVTIMGPHGMGKTSLGATFPSPVFIRAERGDQALIEYESLTGCKIPILPLVESSAQLWNQLKLLAYEEHNFKTAVIDTVSKLDVLFLEEIMDSEPDKSKSVSQALGGYGAVYKTLERWHTTVRAWSEVLHKRGMNVVFLAHTDLHTVDLPDSAAYSKYSLQMEKRGAKPYLNDVDMVGFLCLESFVRGAVTDKTGKVVQKGKAATSGRRVLITYADPAYDTKNRYGITEKLYVDKWENPLTDFIPILKESN